MALFQVNTTCFLCNFELFFTIAAVMKIPIIYSIVPFPQKIVFFQKKGHRILVTAGGRRDGRGMIDTWVG